MLVVINKWKRAIGLYTLGEKLVMFIELYDISSSEWQRISGMDNLLFLYVWRTSKQ